MYGSAFLKVYITMLEIVICLMWLEFDFDENKIQHRSLKMRHFKEAGVPCFKKYNITTIEHLNEILNGNFEAKMVVHSFQVLM
jgi:hypothetical protein